MNASDPTDGAPIATSSVAEFLARAEQLLRAHGRDEPRRLAELLLSRALDCPRLELPLHYTAKVSDACRAMLMRDLARLMDGMPWQYLAGEVEFYGHSLLCDRRALIPRPETELLVDWLLNFPAWRKARAPVVVDIGTGTGCIIIAIALSHPDAVCLATDISADALKLAQANAVKHKVETRIKFMHTNLAENIPANTVDFIIANLPYVTTSEWEKLPVHIRRYEPPAALLGGTDGLDLVNALIRQAACVLKSAGYLFLEVAPSQIRSVSKTMQKSGFTEITTANDYSSRAHFISGRINKKVVA